MGHYADAFEEAGITIEDVYNITNITNEEDCHPLFRLNLLGRHVNFTATECDRLYHYSLASYYEGGQAKYFADLEPIPISLKKRSLKNGGGFNPVLLDTEEELHFIVNNEIEKALHNSFDGGLHGGPPNFVLHSMVVRCLGSSDPSLHARDIGIVDQIDDNGVIHCIWSEGDRIGLIPEEDQYEICERTVNNEWRQRTFAEAENWVQEINIENRHVVQLTRNQNGGFSQVYVPNVGTFTFNYHL